MSDKLVGDLMHRGIIACHPYTPLDEVVRIVSDTDVHAIVVVNEDRCAVGTVTHLDLLRFFSRDLSHHTAQDAMDVHVWTIQANRSAQEAAALMVKEGVHRLIVVEPDDPEGRPVGILSTTDLVKEMRGSRWVWYMR